MTRIARVTEYRTDGTVTTRTIGRDELRLHMPDVGARVCVIWTDVEESGDVRCHPS